MTFTKKIICTALGITGGIVVIPTVGIIGAAGPLYILNKLEKIKIGETTIGQKIYKTIPWERKEYTGWNYDYPKSYASSIFMGGMFCSLSSGCFFRASYHDFKILFSAETCCTTIRAGLFQPAQIVSGLATSGLAIGMFTYSYFLFEYYNKYKNENIWGHTDSWDVIAQRRKIEKKYRREEKYRREMN